MPTIYSYLDQKGFVAPQVLASEPERDANGEILPEWSPPQDPITFLAHMDGRIYISLLDGVTLPGQPTGVDLKVHEVTTEPELFQQLRRESEPCKEINNAIKGAIRQRYSLEDEFQALREADMEYQSFVQELVTTGKAQKAALGL